jgi:hypothetical protein
MVPGVGTPARPKIVGIVSTFDAAQLKVELAWGMQKNTQKKKAAKKCER